MPRPTCSRAPCHTCRPLQLSHTHTARKNTQPPRSGIFARAGGPRPPDLRPQPPSRLRAAAAAAVRRHAGPAGVGRARTALRPAPDRASAAGGAAGGWAAALATTTRHTTAASNTTHSTSPPPHYHSYDHLLPHATPQGDLAGIYADARGVDLEAAVEGYLKPLRAHGWDAALLEMFRWGAGGVGGGCV